jgi:sugar O-acyltransferase (sialic acid O-acetyltransferase NeuD family)
MKLAIYGYGGHAKEVAILLNREITFFVDDEYVVKNTLPISEFNPKEHEIMIAISDCEIREKLTKKLPENTKFFTFIHPTVIIMGNVEIGEGSFIGPYSILTTDIKIGKHAILNRGNQIGHDCLIGDYFSAMPGAIVSGNVTIGDRVYMGTNSSIKEKIKICDDVIIGLNSGVVKDINKCGTYVGVPVKILENYGT